MSSLLLVFYTYVGEVSPRPRGNGQDHSKAVHAKSQTARRHLKGAGARAGHNCNAGRIKSVLAVLPLETSRRQEQKKPLRTPRTGRKRRTAPGPRPLSGSSKPSRLCPSWSRTSSSSAPPTALAAHPGNRPSQRARRPPGRGSPRVTPRRMPPAPGAAAPGTEAEEDLGGTRPPPPAPCTRRRPTAPP